MGSSNIKRDKFVHRSTSSARLGLRWDWKAWNGIIDYFISMRGSSILHSWHEGLEFDRGYQDNLGCGLRPRKNYLDNLCPIMWWHIPYDNHKFPACYFTLSFYVPSWKYGKCCFLLLSFLCSWVVLTLSCLVLVYQLWWDPLLPPSMGGEPLGSCGWVECVTFSIRFLLYTWCGDFIWSIDFNMSSTLGMLIIVLVNVLFLDHVPCNFCWAHLTRFKEVWLYKMYL